MRSSVSPPGGWSGFRVVFCRGAIWGIYTFPLVFSLSGVVRFFLIKCWFQKKIYLLHHAAVMIALVQHLGMDKKDNTVVERVREMEHVPRTDTSRRREPHRLIT